MIAGLAVFLPICVLGYIGYLHYRAKHCTIEDFLNYLLKNPKQSSLCMLVNNQPVLDYHSDRVMPLASTVKIIIAIEYAKQVANGKIKSDQLVSLEELEKFYFKDTDGQAHPKWLKEIGEKNLICEGKVTLEEVAKGMIKYSSNANTEYLYSLLGADSINNTLDELHLPSHTRVYPITSKAIIPTYVREKESFKDKAKWKKRMREMTQEEYEGYAVEIQQQLCKDVNHQFRDCYFKNEGTSFYFQKIMSDRLPAASAKDYAILMSKINRRILLTKRGHEILSRVLEVDSPFHKQIGFKGGSTLYILAFALYVIKEDGEHIEIALFLKEDAPLEKWMNRERLEFIKKLIKEPEYREKVAQILGEGSTKTETE